MIRYLNWIRRRPNTVAIVVLCGAWALFFWRFAAPPPADRLTYPDGDFTQQFGVFRDIAYRAVVEGRLPLWADCLESGYPFHADPQAQLFYLPVWLVFAVLRLGGWGHYPIEALVAEAAFHYLAVSIFLYFFLRSVVRRPAAALLGAVVFTYSGYLTGYPPLQTATLEVVTWLPVSLLAAGRLAEHRKPRYLAGVALGLAMAFFAGHPQTFVYVCLMVLAYFTFRARQYGWGSGAWLKSSAAIVGLTTALTAVQLLPSAHFLLNSTRASVAFEQAGHGFPFADVVQFLVTRLVSHWHPLYVGILPLALALLAMSRVHTSPVRFWTGMALVGLLLSFGTKAIAYDIAYWTVPGIRFFRDQERFALVAAFSLAVLAAIGADSLLGPLNRPTRRWLDRLRRALGWGIPLALVALIVVVYLGRLGIDPTDWQRLAAGVGMSFFALGFAMLALLARTRLPAWRRWAPAVLLGVAILDLFAANRGVNPVPLFEAYPYNPLLDAVRAGSGFFRVQDDQQLPGHAGCAYGYRAIESITPYRLATYSEFLRRAPETVRWSLLGVQYVVTWRDELLDQNRQPVPSDVISRGTVADEKGNVTKVFRLALTQRAFLIHEVEVPDSDDALYARLAGQDFDPRSVVLLFSTLAADADGETDQVQHVRDEPGELTFRVRSGGAAVLLVSEAYFPGWRARVDGRSTPVLRADGALMAVSVPAGEHVVVLDYLPAALLWGAAISVLALAIVAALWLAIK